MALKYKIDEETHKKLSPNIQGEYKKGEDGSYTLDVEGQEDTGALKRAKDHEKELRKGVEQKLKEEQERYKEVIAQMDELRAEKIRGGDKVSEVEKAFQSKIAKLAADHKTEVDRINGALRSHLEENVAISLATELAGENAELLIPHIKGRLRAEIVEGKAVTKILGTDGEVSAATVDELKKEFLTNSKFHAVLIGSKASGGGTGGARKGAGGSQRKSLKEMTATEEALFAKANPEDYKKMVEEGV